MLKPEIERKIAEYAHKLENLNGPDDKRIKKRILQALGKLKKQLASESSATSVDARGDDEEGGEGEVDEKMNLKPVEIVLSRKHLKAKLKLLNKELADCAKKKQLKTAVKRFNWGVRKGMEPDKHTYANLLNCYVRCGDLDGALQQFKCMTEAKVSPNIVIYTTLLKGYCDRGDLSGAQNLLFTEMPINKLTPGIRTLNTFIRGCTKLGAVTSAMRAYLLLHDSSKKSKTDDITAVNTINNKNNKNNESKKKRKRASTDDDEDDGDNDDTTDPTDDGPEGPDGDIGENGKASLLESVVALLCQSLDVEQASLLAVEAVTSLEASRGANASSKNNSTTDCASIYVNLARTCIFTGQHSEAEKWVACATAALEASASSLLRNSMQQNRENQNQIGNGNAKDGKDGKSSRSVDLFLRHRRAEIESELECISDCLGVIRSSSSSSRSNSDAQEVEITCRLGLFQSLSRVLQFGYDGKGDFDKCEILKNEKNDGKRQKKEKPENEGENGIATKLIFALRDKFGLDRVQKTRPSQRKQIWSKEMNIAEDNKALIFMKNKVLKKVSKSVSSETGYINYSELFSSIYSDINENDEDDSDDDEDDDEEKQEKLKALENLPVNIEICSGSGEWVVAHASADMYYPPPKENRKDKNEKSEKNVNGLGLKSKNCSKGDQECGAVPRALWLALELRCDRVYHTISRSVLENIVQHSQHVRTMAQTRSHSYPATQSDTDAPQSLSFSGLSNLAVIGGDASNILPTRLAPCSITSVYINHPEPPERTGGVGDSEGKHLLTQEFFSDVHRILKSSGTVTIVTDNLPYAKSLLHALAQTTQDRLKASQSSSASNASLPCFISVPLDSAHNNDKSDKRILEEEIKIGSKLISMTEVTAQPSKKSTFKGKRNREDSEDDGDEDDDEEQESCDDEDDFTYGNDEDALISENIASSSSKSLATNPNHHHNKSSHQSNNNATKNKNNQNNKISPNKMKEIDSVGSGIEVQVLQLWRGDSAEVDGANDGSSESVRASSYFDRMWERGQKKRRWFMVLKKYE